MFETPAQLTAFAIIVAAALMILINLGFIFYEAIYGGSNGSTDKPSSDGLPEDEESGESDNS